MAVGALTADDDYVRKAALSPPSPLFLQILVGLILPNLLAWCARLVGLGVPPRGTAMAVYCLVALAAPLLHPVLLAVALFGAVAFDVVMTVAVLFNFSPREFVAATLLGTQVDLAASSLYVTLVLCLAAFTTANTAVLLATRQRLRKSPRIVFCLVALAAITVEEYAAASPHYSYGSLASIGQPFESAAEASGFEAAIAAGADDRHILMVVVESLGKFVDPRGRELLLAPFRDPDLARHYELSTGDTSFFGATSAGEMRELCHSRQSYIAVLAGADPDCIPEVLAARGYRTNSVHGFHSDFYNRSLWYPKIGFARSVFEEQMMLTPRRLCGGSFRGPCDVDTADRINVRFQAATQPTFTYWLTLNTHVPIAPAEGTPRFRCAEPDRAVPDTEVCYMSEMWVDVFERIKAIALANRPMEILIVGDHAPPLWRSRARDLFEPGRVPWVRLVPKNKLKLRRLSEETVASTSR